MTRFGRSLWSVNQLLGAEVNVALLPAFRKFRAAAVGKTPPDSVRFARHRTKTAARVGTEGMASMCARTCANDEGWMSLCGHFASSSLDKRNFHYPWWSRYWPRPVPRTSITRRYSAVNAGLVRLLHPEMRLTIADHLFEVSLRARTRAHGRAPRRYLFRSPIFLSSVRGTRSHGRDTSNKGTIFFFFSAQFLRDTFER